MQNNRLLDALHMQTACTILHDEPVQLYYDQLRARDVGNNSGSSHLVGAGVDRPRCRVGD
ncbi:hypothetical protein [Rhodococcus pyridinivorans]|uniref:hypothetical protein n=1 Tax=Rhodococcus pyridinivorans TaxID=103816 RepID=UPI003AAB9040